MGFRETSLLYKLSVLIPFYHSFTKNYQSKRDIRKPKGFDIIKVGKTRNTKILKDGEIKLICLYG